MNRILVTCFEPFGGCKTNSSLEAVRGLQDVEVLLLPVSYSRSREILLKKILEYKPDFVLSFGQAGGADMVRLEKVGINLMTATIPDNDGISKVDERMDDGPDAIFTDINIPSLMMALDYLGIKSKMSLSAGGYICNTVYYTALKRMNKKALFVHLPYLEGEGNPSYSKEELIKVASSILSILKNQ